MSNLSQFGKYSFWGKTDQIMDHINFIDELIELERYQYIPIESRKILEILLFAEQGDSSLNDLIVLYRRTTNPPVVISKAMMFLKEKGNEAAHSLSILEKNYGLDFDKHSAVEIQKNLFIVLRYFTEIATNGEVDISTIKFSNNGQGTKTAVNKKSVGSSANKKRASASPDLKRLIQTVGMKTFIEYYDAWESETYIKSITADGTVSEFSARMKAKAANKIMELGLAKDALELVSESTRIHSSLVKEAKRLLKLKKY